MKSLFYTLILSSLGCHPSEPPIFPSLNIEYGPAVRVRIPGYTGNAMEPFLTRDGRYLLFNNLNASPENTNLYWAIRTNDSVFEYQGEIKGINTTDLEAVPSMDSLGELYFISNRSYSNTLSTIYHGRFSAGNVSNIQLVPGVSRLKGGSVNFDAEISADGKTLYFVDAEMNAQGMPKTADLVIAQKTDTGFERFSNSDSLMEKINTDDLEYAPCISRDGLELIFTRFHLPAGPTSVPEILISKRQRDTDQFGKPEKIQSISGFAEAATISDDNELIYYHKKEADKYVIYLIKKN